MKYQTLFYAESNKNISSFLSSAEFAQKVVEGN